MSNAWGLAVDKSPLSALASGDYSVDSMTLIVRNPGTGTRNGEQVHSVCETGGCCSGIHLHDRTGIRLLVHKSTVLTGTTGIVEFLKDRR
jgi:hypothetical protein